VIKYSIGITTFEHRFEKFFKPLIEQIKGFRPDIEVMVAINGENKIDFNQTYRADVLKFIGEHTNVFPNVYTEFRSLAKLWNNLLINASNHTMLLLNDDVSITSELFFNNLEEILESDTFFKINGSWSHTVLNRLMISELNWFDERFLGIGEEDGDMEWQIGMYSDGGTIKSIEVPNIVNHVDGDNVLRNIKKVNTKYSQFNLDFIHGHKYEIDPVNGQQHGVNPRPLVLKNPKPPLHATELFYWNNKGEL
jgi:hypothetical protein